ncbi:hypothetical protein TRVL_09844 [Trypanosoma vivax]|nr:hypothetical protein TRVL_09844 [Trypanosoma vivax]
MCHRSDLLVPLENGHLNKCWPVVMCNRERTAGPCWCRSATAVVGLSVLLGRGLRARMCFSKSVRLGRLTQCDQLYLSWRYHASRRSEWRARSLAFVYPTSLSALLVLRPWRS